MFYLWKYIYKVLTMNTLIDFNYFYFKPCFFCLDFTVFYAL